LIENNLRRLPGLHALRFDKTAPKALHLRIIRLEPAPDDEQAEECRCSLGNGVARLEVLRDRIDAFAGFEPRLHLVGVGGDRLEVTGKPRGASLFPDPIDDEADSSQETSVAYPSRDRVVGEEQQQEKAQDPQEDPFQDVTHRLPPPAEMRTLKDACHRTCPA